MATIRDEDVDQLVCMGFPNIEVRNALQITAGNLENAVNHLLSGGGAGGGGGGGGGGLAAAVPTTQHMASPNNNNNNSGNNSGVRAVVEGTISQYTYSSDGRSACTCIALTVADMILNNDMTTTTTTTTSNNISEDDTNNNDIITTEFLDSAIAEGVSRYRRLVTSSSSSGSEIEHLSAEEVLRMDNEQARTNDNGTDTDNNNNNNNANANANDSTTTKRIFDVEVNVHGGIRQGALSIDINHALGMKSCLEGLVRDIRASGNSNNSDRMICVLLTKTPETVLLCIPTTDDVVDDTTTTTTTNQKYYWLIDSHPRPQLLPGVETCYAKSHLTMNSLLQSLRDVFPFTDLGPDVPPMMADMYNMYDLYPLEGRRRR